MVVIQPSSLRNNTCKEGHLNRNADNKGKKNGKRLNFSQPPPKKVLLFWSFYYGENAIAGFSFAGLMFPSGEIPVRRFAGLIFASGRLPV